MKLAKPDVIKQLGLIKFIGVISVFTSFLPNQSSAGSLNLTGRQLKQGYELGLKEFPLHLEDGRKVYITAKEAWQEQNLSSVDSDYCFVSGIGLDGVQTKFSFFS